MYVRVGLQVFAIGLRLKQQIWANADACGIGGFGHSTKIASLGGVERPERCQCRVNTTLCASNPQRKKPRVNGAIVLFVFSRNYGLCLASVDGP